MKDDAEKTAKAPCKVLGLCLRNITATFPYLPGCRIRRPLALCPGLDLMPHN